MHFKRRIVFTIPYIKIIPGVFKTEQTNPKPPMLYNKKENKTDILISPKEKRVDRVPVIMNLKIKYNKHVK